MPTSNLPIASYIAWSVPRPPSRSNLKRDRPQTAGVRSQGQGQPSDRRQRLQHSPSKPFFLVKTWSKNSLLYLRDKPERRLDLLDQHLGIWLSTLKLPRIPSDPNVMSQGCQEKLESGRKPSGGWMTKPDVCVRNPIVGPFATQQLLEPVDQYQGKRAVFEQVFL